MPVCKKMWTLWNYLHEWPLVDFYKLQPVLLVCNYRVKLVSKLQLH